MISKEHTDSSKHTDFEWMEQKEQITGSGKTIILNSYTVPGQGKQEQQKTQQSQMQQLQPQIVDRVESTNCNVSALYGPNHQLHLISTHPPSRVAHRKCAGPITQRLVDRNHILLPC